MPLTLAFDTSAEACSVALLRNGDALAEEREYMARVSGINGSPSRFGDG